jgi:hypothetical protein
MSDTLTLYGGSTSGALRPGAFRSDLRASTLPKHIRVVGPDEVETTLLARYAALVRLAYLILPPTLGRNRRILAAHDVVQHSLPRRELLECQLIGVRDAVDFIRRRVAQAAIGQARARTPLRLLPLAWAFRLVAPTDAYDLILAGRSPEARAAWALEHSDTAAVFDPCSARVCPTELRRRNTRGSIVAVSATAVLAIAILASLITTA